LSSGQERQRFGVFKTNFDAAASKNSADAHATWGVTQFMDMTPEEFKSEVLMTKFSPLEFPNQHNVMNTSKFRGVGVPTSYDWGSKGVLTPVKNQGQCGSCWDFSATETYESVCALAGYPLTKLSEQQIVDCDSGDYGCSGGWPYGAYKYIMSAGGLDTEADYPYQASNGNCQADSSKFYKCPLATWQYVTESQDENTMQSFLYSNSPLSVCVDASSWQYYTGGVLMASNCGTQLDHCVQATGWSVQNGVVAWNVRNSWGASWGNNGYIYLQFGQNTCGVAQVVTVPCVTSTSGNQVC
jgi:C1A family cysteine protease